MNISIPMLSITPHGGNRVLIEIANHLSANGVNVEVITSSYDKENINYTLDKLVNVKVLFECVTSKYLRWFLFLLAIPFFCKGKVILANHFLTAIPSRISSLIYQSKFLYFVQDIEFEFYRRYGYVGKLLKVWCLLTYKLGGVVSANPYLTKRLERYCHVIYDFNLGVNRSLVVPGTNTKNYDVIYFARKEVHKGLDRFERILALNTEIKFLCISQDETLLERLEKNKNVSVVKPTSELELQTSVSSARVLLLTSYHEGFSLPPLESMRVGVPLVYFECGGPSVYCNKNNSVLIDKCEDFEDALHLIDSNYSEFAHNSILTSRLFSQEKSCSDFFVFLKGYLK